MKKILFVTGFQKSGTSLLNRLLMSQNFIENPFLPEGKFFWGDDPVENPTSQPCGEIYQKHKAKQGHQLYKNDYSDNHKVLLWQRIYEVSVKQDILMNKNPNLIVRLPWLRRVFPESKVVVMLRKPIPNIYSFSKKLYNDKQTNPEYWWGVKPNNWQSMIHEDMIVQIVSQWKSVFTSLLKDIDNVDLFIRYDKLCENPLLHLEKVLELAEVDKNRVCLNIEKIKCMDDEYKEGGNIQSNNVYLRKENTFQIPNQENRINYKPLDKSNIEYIKQETESIWRDLQRLVRTKMV
ncbi:MAG: sulfotransferase [Ignavibacteriae bacterium]|nr:sulfotransferase [Ignavibacteriota bacterium]